MDSLASAPTAADRKAAMPLVSVIMPCFNHAHFLEDSVNGILRQSTPDLELIVVDDCSTDNSWESIRRLAAGDARIKAIRHERNQGASRARNDGLKNSRGEFIGFCDADDIWEKGKLDEQIELLRKNPDFDVVYCDSLIIDEKGASTGRRFSELFPPPRSPSGWLFPELIRRNFINMQGVLMRKQCARLGGGFDENIKWIEDWCYWVALSRFHRFLYTPSVLAKYRVHHRSSNVLQQRGYGVNRFKARKRMLRTYHDLPSDIRADAFFKMGTDLCELRKRRLGRQLLWKAVGLSLWNIRAFGTLCRALRRILLSATRDQPL